jgi:lipopolysaccharide transport system permease protein
MLSNVRTLFRYRQLIAALTSRDLKARYRGSILGFFWSLANPLLLLGVYTLVFTKFFHRSGISPYPLFLFAGILPWTFFSASILESTNALSSNSGLIKKVMFPAETLPLVVVFSHLMHFILALPVLLAALVIAVAMGKVAISPALLLAPLLMLLQTMLVAGFALAISSTSVLFRDLRDLVANLMQLGFFLTPVIYAFTDITSRPLRVLLRFNPMTPFVMSYQSIFFFARVPSTLDFVLMITYAFAALTLGFMVFDRLRDTLAEAI